MIKPYCLLCAVLFLVSGCATLTTPRPPKTTGAVGFETGLLDKKAVNGAKQVGNSAVYYNQTQGGSIAFGLLGPIGWLANSGLIESKRSEEAGSLALKINVDLYALVKDSLKTTQSIEAKSTAFSLEPFILMQSTKAGEILTSLVYLVVQKSGNETVWKEKYYYHFARRFPQEMLTSGGSEFKDYLAASMPSAIVELTEFVVTDLSSTTKDSKEVTIKSDHFGPLALPFKAVMISNINGTSKLRVIANEEYFENIYIRGMHIFSDRDAEIL